VLKKGNGVKKELSIHDGKILIMKHLSCEEWRNGKTKTIQKLLKRNDKKHLKQKIIFWAKSEKWHVNMEIATRDKFLLGEKVGWT
jgi:hypothetical protein